jgi:hypothetical protein
MFMSDSSFHGALRFIALRSSDTSNEVHDNELAFFISNVERTK